MGRNTRGPNLREVSRVHTERAAEAAVRREVGARIAARAALRRHALDDGAARPVAQAGRVGRRGQHHGAVVAPVVLLDGVTGSGSAFGLSACVAVQHMPMSVTDAPC